MSDSPARPAVTRRYLDVPGVAALLGFSEEAVRARVKSGTIPYRKIGGRVAFDERDIERWFALLPGVTVNEALRIARHRGAGGGGA